MDHEELKHKHLVALGGGYYVQQDVLNIVERIRDYDPNLRVKYLDRGATIDQAPYALTEICKDGIERLVFFIWDLDERVLERLYAADNAKFDVYTEMNLKNATARANSNRRYEERRLEAIDITKYMLKSPKGVWSWKEDGKKVTVDDDPTSGPAKVEYDESG